MLKTLFQTYVAPYAIIISIVAGVTFVGGAWYGVSSHYYNKGYAAHKKEVDDANAAALKRAEENRNRAGGPADCNSRVGMFYNSATGECERQL